MKSKLVLSAFVVLAVFMASLSQGLASSDCASISLSNTGPCTEFVKIFTNGGSYGPFAVNPNVTITVSLGADECLTGFKINGCWIPVSAVCASDQCVEICPGPCPLDVTRFLCKTDDTCCNFNIN